MGSKTSRGIKKGGKMTVTTQFLGGGETIFRVKYGADSFSSETVFARGKTMAEAKVRAIKKLKRVITQVEAVKYPEWLERRIK